MKLGHLLEGGPVRDGEHEEEALAGPHVLFPHRRELLLAGRVQDVQLRHPVIDDTLFGVRILDSRIIVRHEVAL